MTERPSHYKGLTDEQICSNKRWYEKRKWAKQASKQLKGASAYRCKVCDGWHITTLGANAKAHLRARD